LHTRIALRVLYEFPHAAVCAVLPQKAATAAFKAGLVREHAAGAAEPSLGNR
jgi:hypothetical protein